MKHLLLITLTLLICTSCTSLVDAQNVTFPDDTQFYNPSINAFEMIIDQPDGSADNSGQLQVAIDAVAEAGGGILTINAPANTNVYMINEEVQLKTNVHIRVAPNVTFSCSTPKKITLFSAGKKSASVISNFSMSCTDPGSYFTVDFSNREAGSRNGGAIAVSLGGVTNFKVSDIYVKDNFTQFSSVTINLLNLPDDQYLFANDGIIEHLKTEKGHYGYGTIQNQAGINILYRNLEGEGGATLRLETGAIGKAHAIDHSIRLHNIYAYNIFCKDGQAAVTLSPHTVNNGLVTIDNVRAESCEAGAIVASGFLSAKKGEKDEAGNALPGYEYGYFDANSSISNLTVVYGTNAQLRPQRREFIPCSQRHLLAQELNPDEESFKGPTVAGIIYFAKGGTDRDSGFYTVDMPEFTMEGFPLVDGVMENKEYVASNKELLKDCKYSGIVSLKKLKKKKK